MLIPLACALALSLTASAQTPAGVALREIAEIPAAGSASSDGALFASTGETSINVWRLQDGRQIHRIPLPRILKRDDNDYVSFGVSSFSPDDKSLLLITQRSRFGEKSELAIYLVDLDKETMSQIYAARLPCFNIRGGIQPWICPSDSAGFSPDGKRILVTVFAYIDIGGPQGPEHYQDETLVVDLNGSVLEHFKEVFRQDILLDRPNPPPVAETTPTGARRPGFGANGHLLGVIVDDSGCEIRDLTSGKRVSFLEDCKSGENVSFIGPDALSTYWYSCSKDCSGKYWDAKTGTVRKVEYGNAGGVEFTANGAFALAVLLGGPDKRMELRAAPFDRVLYSTPTDAEEYYEWSFTDGAAYALKANSKRTKTVVYETGLPHGNAAASFVAPPVAAAPVIDVDSPPATKAKADPDAFAVVIGVEKYRQSGIPAVDFAARDAQTMASYLTGSMGFDPKNVVLLTDAQATRTDFEKYLKWLKNRVTANSRVFVYYAGHGSPDPTTGEGYLLPYEADPSYLDETAFPIAKLYASLGKLPTKDVTVVLDACFSGQGGRSLIAKGTRPLVSVIQSKAEPNTVVLAAAGSNQVSASFPEARHGLLTYYLLAGLKGEADAKHDGNITADELIAYVRPAVERAAKLQNVEQTPSLMSPAEAVSRPWIVLAPKN